MIALAQGRDRPKPIANSIAVSKNKTWSLYQKMLVTEKMFCINNAMAYYSKNRMHGASSNCDRSYLPLVYGHAT